MGKDGGAAVEFHEPLAEGGERVMTVHDPLEKNESGDNLWNGQIEYAVSGGEADAARRVTVKSARAAEFITNPGEMLGAALAALQNRYPNAEVVWKRGADEAGNTLRDEAVREWERRKTEKEGAELPARDYGIEVVAFLTGEGAEEGGAAGADTAEALDAWREWNKAEPEDAAEVLAFLKKVSANKNDGPNDAYLERVRGFVKAADNGLTNGAENPGLASGLEGGRAARAADIMAITPETYEPRALGKREAKALFGGFAPVSKSFTADFIAPNDADKKPRANANAGDGQNVGLNVTFPKNITGKLVDP